MDRLALTKTLQTEKRVSEDKHMLAIALTIINIAYSYLLDDNTQYNIYVNRTEKIK